MAQWPPLNTPLCQIIITNEIGLPETILKASIPIPLYIRESVLLRRIIGIASHLCTVVGVQQFRIESRKLPKKNYV